MTEKKNRTSSTTPRDASGSNYHRKRASNTPDYGGNIQDPVVERKKQ